MTVDSNRTVKEQTTNLTSSEAEGTALITGAAGFLGSHLCDKFVKEGYQVIGMDNLITGDIKNIEHLFFT